MVGFGTPQRTSEVKNKTATKSVQISKRSPKSLEKKRSQVIGSPSLDSALSDLKSPSSCRSLKIPKSSHVRVVARIRPFNPIEIRNNAKACIIPIQISSSPPTSIINNYGNSPRNSFHFNESSPRASPSLRNKSMSPIRRCRSPSPSLGTPRRKTGTPKMPPSQNTPRSRFGTEDSETLNRVENHCNSLKILNSSNKKFDFDAVFGPTSTQHDVYERSVGDAVRRNLFRGFNTTILTFGQTGSGKTYTMSGNEGSACFPFPAKETPRKSISDIILRISEESKFGEEKGEPPITTMDDDGILVRSVNDLFRGRAKHTGCVTIKLTYIEIYNDEIRDLLADPISNGPKSELELRDYGEGGINIKNLTKIEVKRPAHVIDLISIGSQRRVSGVTRMNETSSRSHAICTLHVTIGPPSMSSASSNKGALKPWISTDTIYAKLTLVDLAGSERVKMAKTEGVQQKESISINTDLLVLGKVVNALAEKKHQASRRRSSNIHVPYRDSVLTRLLRDSLGGNCHTVMVACISPSTKNLEESVNTLRYAMRTRSINNYVVRNVVKKKLTAAEMIAIRRENKKIRAQLVDALERLERAENAPCKCQKRDEENDSESVAELRRQLAINQDELDRAKTLDEAKVLSRLEFLIKVLSDLGIKIDLSDTLKMTDEGLKDHILSQQQSPLLSDKIHNDKSDEDTQLSDESFPSVVDIETESLTADPTLDQDTTTKQILKERLEDEEFALQERVAGLSIEFDELNEKLQTTKKLDEKFTNEIIEKEEQRNMIIADTSYAMEENEKVKELRGQISDLLIEHKILLESIRELNEQEDMLSRLLHVMKGEISRAENDIETKKVDIEALQQKIENLKNQEMKLVSKLKGFHEISDVIQKLEYEESVRHDFEMRTEVLENDLKQVTEEKENYKKAKEILEASVVLAESKESLKNQVSVLTTERNLLVEEVKNYQDVSDVLEDLNAEQDNVNKLEYQNKELESEIKRLSVKHDALQLENTNLLKKIGKLVNGGKQNDTRSIISTFTPSVTAGEIDDKTVTTMDSNSIREHAEKVLSMAKEAMDKRENRENKPHNRNVLPNPNRILQSHDNPKVTDSHSLVQSTGFHQTKRSRKESCCSRTVCTCVSSNFSGNSDHIEFFLPKLGKACKCSNDLPDEMEDYSNPTNLTNILRAWQVRFLATLGITTARQLISARRTESRKLAKAMISWRRNANMKPVKLKSCFVALHIWSRTAKVIIRSQRDASRNRNISSHLNGSPQFPDFMEVCFSSDRSVSTLGEATFGDMMEI